MLEAESVAWLREALGNAPLMQTAKKLAVVLARGDIPHVIVGGLAVQEHGYVRTTYDVDIVVPDIDEARDYLSIRGFQEVPGTTMKLKDRDNRVEVDLLPGGGFVGPAVLPLPVPQSVSAQPQFIDFAGLIEQKLSSYLGDKINRLKDGGDVSELLKKARPPRDLPVHEAVRNEYCRLWDGLHERGLV